MLQAYDSAGNLLEQSAGALGPTGGVFAAWVGFKRPKDDIAVIPIQPAQPLPSGDDYVIDNIYCGRKVPEPSSLLLLLVGIAGLGFL